MDDNIDMRDNKQERIEMKKFLPTKEFWLCVLAFLFGCVCFGCKAPPVSYTIQTNCPDVWAEQPKQQVTVKMEFRRWLNHYYYSSVDY